MPVEIVTRILSCNTFRTPDSLVKLERVLSLDRSTPQSGMAINRLKRLILGKRVSYKIMSRARATNLVQNGGFETGDLTSWSPSIPNENVTVVSGASYEGTYSLEIGGIARIGQLLDQAMANKISFWAKCSNPSETSYITIEFWSEGLYYGFKTAGPISGTWQIFELDPLDNQSYDEFRFSTFSDMYPEPGSVDPEPKLIDNVSISP